MSKNAKVKPAKLPFIGVKLYPSHAEYAEYQKAAKACNMSFSDWGVRSLNLVLTKGVEIYGFKKGGGVKG